MPQHAYKDGDETDGLAHDRAHAYIVDIIDQPSGGRDQAQLACAARILQHKSDGKRGHSDNGQDLDQEVDEFGLNAEHGEAEHIERNVAGDKADKP